MSACVCALAGWKSCDAARKSLECEKKPDRQVAANVLCSFRSEKKPIWIADPIGSAIEESVSKFHCNRSSSSSSSNSSSSSGTGTVVK